MKKTFITYLLFINIFTLFLFYLDKQKAKKNKTRIMNKTLMGATLIGGSLGALFGMYMFRHKTKTWYYKIFVPIFFILHIAIIILNKWV